MQTWDAIFRELADDPADFERAAGLAVFVRHGTEFTLKLADRPGAGPSVEVSDGGKVAYLPISTYIQRSILDLPRLGSQIIKTIDKTWSKRPARFVDGPAQAETTDRRHEEWERVSVKMSERLVSSEPGTTHVVQLMAPAGRGKTALLDHLAQEFAKAYSPTEYPHPLLLPVDLLGRYVGTVDDAIAGSLNNTFLFPGLSQRDVALGIKKRWLVLALDGFDELVARVGVRDAFGRVTELLDQLAGSGTIVLSARESFFDLHQISAAIRSYLQPRTGSYTTSVVTLQKWGMSQGTEIFSKLGSKQPAEELGGLLSAFEGDTEIVLHPFFLARLAELWVKGERFKDASGLSGELQRSKYVIETMVQREANEKWVGRDQRPLLPLEGHLAMLGTVAEEMWRSGAFRLSKDELTIAAEMGLGERNTPSDIVHDVLERLPTHATLISRERWFSFVHDMFLYFFLGLRLAVMFKRRDKTAARDAFCSRELTRQVIEWLGLGLSGNGVTPCQVVGFLNEIVEGVAEGSAGANAGSVTASVLRDRSDGANVEVVHQTFQGDSLRGGRYENLAFRNCAFWELDLRGCSFKGCTFEGCTFGDVLVARSSSFAGCRFTGCRVASLEVEGERTLYAPADVLRVFETLGAEPAVIDRKLADEPLANRRVQEDVIRVVERFVKASVRTTDVAVEDLEEDVGSVARTIAKMALKHGVMREVEKAVSGPHKTFVRFCVDKKKALRGQSGATGDASVDGFWSELEQKFAPRT